MNRKKAKKKAKEATMPTVAVQARSRDGRSHIVGIGNLRVILMHDQSSKSWFARGLEIDYAAQGDSEEDVKNKFAEGLRMTICENLKVYGTIKRLLKIAPQDVWSELFGNTKALYSQVSMHPIVSTNVMHEELPFPGITYIPIQRHVGAALHV